MKQPERNINRYRNTDTKKATRFPFDIFKTFHFKENLTQSNNEFIYNIMENPEKTNIQQILTKNFDQNNY